MLVVASATIGTVASADSVRLGDVNGDKAVTISDVTEIQRKLAEFPISDSFSIAAADIDGSERIEITDATLIQRWLADFKMPYKIGEYLNSPGENPTQSTTEPPTQRPTDSEGWGRDIYQPWS